nr:PH domain-containing protein [Azospirillum sp. SYSU D00513]
MGLFDALLGHASEVTSDDIQKEYGTLLAPSETVERAYKLVRDLFIFTNKRMILVDKQGITGRKVKYHSIPYRSITHFSIETSGTFDLDAELKIWISGTEKPIEKTFNKSLNVYGLQALLAEYVLR